MWKVRAEITGEFVTVEKFRDFDVAIDYYDRLFDTGIYNELDIWFVKE